MQFIASCALLAGGLAIAALILLRCFLSAGQRFDCVVTFRGEAIPYGVKFSHPLPRFLTAVRGAPVHALTVRGTILVLGARLTAIEHAHEFSYVYDHCAREDWRGVDGLIEIVLDLAARAQGPHGRSEKKAIAFAVAQQKRFKPLDEKTLARAKESA